jgi:hypothetical protein
MPYADPARGLGRQNDTPLFENPGVPVNGTSGTLAGIAGPGALMIDTTNAKLYQNTNTKVSPTWALVMVVTQQADVANLAATTNITAVPGTFADLAAVVTYLSGANMVPNIEARLDGLEAKVNALLAALRLSGVIL